MEQIDDARINKICEGYLPSCSGNAQLLALAIALGEQNPDAKMTCSKDIEGGSTIVNQCSVVEAVCLSPDTMRPILDNLMEEVRQVNPSLHMEVKLRARQILTGKQIEELIKDLTASQLMLMLLSSS